jgi:hypothetical protein
LIPFIRSKIVTRKGKLLLNDAVYTTSKHSLATHQELNNGDKYNLDIIKKMDPDIFDIDFEKSNTLLQSKLKLLEQETDQTKIDNYKKDIRIIVNTYHNTQPKYASAAPDVRIRSSKGGLKRLPDDLIKGFALDIENEIILGTKK